MKKGRVEMPLDDYNALLERKEEFQRDSDELYEILSELFANTSLDYTGEFLYFNSGMHELLEYLKIKEKSMYYNRLEQLKNKNKEE